MIGPMSDPAPHRAEIVVDVAAIRHNVRILKDLVSVDGPVGLMTVVKADGRRTRGRCGLARCRHHRRGARAASRR
jgi:hypothetical protein